MAQNELTIARPMQQQGNQTPRLSSLARFLDAALGRRLAEHEVALGPTAAWSRRVSRGAKLAVVEGTVMVTFEGDLEDYVLSPGGAFTAPGRGRVAALAFQPSVIRVAG